MSTFYQERFDFSKPETIETEFERLVQEPIDSVEKLESWILDQAQIFDAINEGLRGHYIDFQSHSDSQVAKEKVERDQEKIEPLLKRYQALLDQKFIDTPYKDELDQDTYGRFMKMKENALDLFREENIDLEVEEDRLTNQYFEITGSLTVDWYGEEKTLSLMSSYLQDSNRDVRKQAFTSINDVRLKHKDSLQSIMDELIALRQKKTTNAGLNTFTDYMFKEYERFDYTPEDCKQLAESIREHVVPLKNELMEKEKERLQVDTLKPWDLSASPAGQSPLKPFHTTEELIEKSSSIFTKLDASFASLLTDMQKKGTLDLDTRKGKAPGGFCDFLPLSQSSFIFMNADTSHDDMITLLHEMGHCIHNHRSEDIKLPSYREAPMESAELASMTMELLTMDYWDHFYDDEEDLLRAKREQLEGIIHFLPGGIVIDQLQHWMYEHPNHTAVERNAKFKELKQNFGTERVDWSEHEETLENSWLKVLHIFEVPFYYVEYVIAQLGAVQMYKQYKENPKQALENYKNALSLGNTKSLPEVYQTAGIRFDFSAETIQDLMTFIKQELDALETSQS
ncbi:MULTISPECIES: M3 family oligoendopeptidase [Pontibacillus]|uniref:M3 family oligoendopeptidase n=1 Tax=Pontibacillus chungwhensis TaxID=265426 RepID=A0ABY8UYK1_9BACI|nr:MULTISPECIES: M3 family oligoendopeptidase [Pontibacillus]MCD5325232.1 M3 family oligoendopeptidase [Pontibacillus sp. HN14]WIF97480.1 M3 family oligoendopeptidase [Pontibacillus chungwhensis]